MSSDPLVVQGERIPAPGETVLADAFLTVPGGKGANQAAAAARLGGEVTFVGCVGADPYGARLLSELQAAGVHTDCVAQAQDLPTGVALISVDADGQNAIMVVPGANNAVLPAMVEAVRDRIAVADALVLQLETPLETVVCAVQAAHAAGVPVLLNPAPMRQPDLLPAWLWSQVAALVPNEHEAAALIGEPDVSRLDPEDAARELNARGVATVFVTLGSRGCLIADAQGIARLPALPVRAVDTTAAGDCFTGALAVALAEGRPPLDAARFAVRAAGLSVTRMGALPSLPVRAEVEALQRTREGTSDW